MHILYLLYQAVLCLVYLNEQSCPLIGRDPSRVCSCRFPGRRMTGNYNMESMVPTEIEAVSPIPDEKFGDLYYYYYYYYHIIIITISFMQGIYTYIPETVFLRNTMLQLFCRYCLWCPYH
jgi:hypothetical protein